MLAGIWHIADTSMSLARWNMWKCREYTYKQRTTQQNERSAKQYQ